MCAINPKRKRSFTLSVYTALDMTEDEFQKLVYDKTLEAEATLNTDARLRWHVEEK